MLFTSCFEDNDDSAALASEINDFVWKGMNAAYLYKQEISDLDNDRFNDSDEYASYLNHFTSPENLFESNPAIAVYFITVKETIKST